MKKNIVILIVVGVILILAIGVVYFFWQGGPEIRRLNKNLPEGIRIEKRGDQQVIVNKKDGYEIKVPKDWGGVREVEYLSKESGLTIGAQDTEDWVSVSVYEVLRGIDFDVWLKQFLKDHPLSFPEKITSIIGEEKIKNYKVIKIKVEHPMTGTTFFYYFQTDSHIYEIYTDYSEKSIRAVILNGNF